MKYIKHIFLIMGVILSIPAFAWPVVDMFHNTVISNQTLSDIYLYNDTYGASTIPIGQNNRLSYQLVSHGQHITVITNAGAQDFVIGCNNMEQGLVNTNIYHISYNYPNDIYTLFRCSLNGVFQDSVQYEVYIMSGAFSPQT